MKYIMSEYIFFLCSLYIVNSIELPDSCNSTQYYDPGAMMCQLCPANASMVRSSDGFTCSCEEHSIPSGRSRCRPCNATELVSSDGRSCVPRHCQASYGRTVCRKCPADYINVTQNLDGTPTKEVQCIKCARGYKAVNNACVRCESCACSKQEVVMRGRCLPKKFVDERPKYEQTKIHPNELLDLVKEEYFCTQNDLLACRALANNCVRSFYSSELAGPCRLWLQPKITPPKGLPKLIVDTTSNDQDPNELGLTRGMDTLQLVSVIYTASGGLRIIYDPDESTPCFLPLNIAIGKDLSTNCQVNVSKMASSLNETLAPMLNIDGDLRPLPITLKKPGDLSIQRGSWPSSKFRRYFLYHNTLSITANMTNSVYLKTMVIRVRIERNKSKPTLRLRLSLEAQYATKPPLTSVITTTIKVKHEMPNAGVLRGLEIWGGVLGAFLSLYGLAQWRGNMRRGGLQCSLAPYLAAAVADTLYFAAWFSTLHALAAEAGTLGITLPLSHSEEHMVMTFVYSAVGLKAFKVAWVNYSQCKCDIFFLDWSEYNPPIKDRDSEVKSESWRASVLAREWSRVQTIRRASPAYTVILALIISHLINPWQSSLPQSRAYRWAAASIAWWCAYTLVLTIRCAADKLLGPPTTSIPLVCKSLGVSLLVFQEEFYAHYVHGRTVYKQLSTPGGFSEKESRKVLLSKFLAAFFERALDGLSWVASERTIPERLLDVELVAREAGSTSILLYDSNDTAPSCFAVTWWGEEWTLSTFDAMVFGCVFIATNDILLTALTVLLVWQVTKLIRSGFGNKNQMEKTDTDVTLLQCL